MTSELRELQEWYESQCDGDWEHSYGVRIETLDNPGWLVKIDLEDTDLEGREFSEVSNLAPEREWIHCKVSEGKFSGAGGASMLNHILRAFLDWARGAQAEPQPPAV